MNSILDNPYRILGVLANASAREINTRVNKLRMYIDADGEIPKNDDFGFPDSMGKPERSNTAIDKAKSELNLDNDRVANALFWFWKNNDISDEAAFDALKDVDADTAIGIWQKLTDKGEVTERNCSAFLNLSTLLLYLSSSGNTIQKVYFAKGLHLKIQFLESRFSEEFVKKVGDETYKKNTAELELFLLNQLRHDLGIAKGLTLAEMVEMLSGWAFAAKDKFLKDLSGTLSKEINDKVKTCSSKREKTPEKADKLADELYNSVSKDLLQLKKMLGESNITYSNVADETAQEILQCSIDFYNKSDDSALKEFNNLFTSLKNIDEKPRAKTIDSAKNLLTEAKPILRKMKTAIDQMNNSTTTKELGGGKVRIMANDLKKKGSPAVNKRSIALELLEKAQSIAVGHAIRQRCEENRKIISNNSEELDLNTVYINMSTRIADNALSLMIEEIKNSSGITQLRRDSVIRMLDEMLTFDLTSDYRKTINEIKGQITGGGGDPKVNRAIDELVNLINGNKIITTAEVEPHLQFVKNALGKSNDTYLQISSAIANKILGDHIAAVNEAQEYINTAYDKKSALSLLNGKIGSAVFDIIKLLSDWDLTSDVRNRLETNKSTLLNLSTQLGNFGKSREEIRREQREEQRIEKQKRRNNSITMWFSFIGLLVGLILGIYSGGWGNIIWGIIAGYGMGWLSGWLIALVITWFEDITNINRNFY